MRTPRDIHRFGLFKLAEMSEEYANDTALAPTGQGYRMSSPATVGRMMAAPTRAIDYATRGTFSAPTPQEAQEMNAYSRSALVGGLTGSAVSALLAVLTKRPVLPHIGVGAGAGLLSGLTRQYDQSADPPGLSPVYTIPAGLRLGALTGGLAGFPLGRLTGAGILPGILSGAAGGAAAGGAVSSFI